MAEFLQHLWSHYTYIVYILLMVIGLYAVLAKSNLVKKVIGLNILQTAVFLFYLSIGKVDGALAPIIWDPEDHEATHVLEGAPYENPLPHVLMLTAIVVSVSITAVALALVVRMKRAYGTIEEGEILALDEAARERAAWPEAVEEEA